MINIPIILIFIPVVTSILIYLFKWRHMNLIAFAAQLVMTVLAIHYYLYYRGAFELTHIVLGGWDARIGISLVNDELSMSFIFLTLFTWWMVIIYTYAFGKTKHTFLFFLFFLQGVFLGLLQSNDLFNLFVFFELTTIIVTILIAYKKVGESYRAAIYYLLLNTSGVLIFLLGIILIYFNFGTINMVEITQLMHTVEDTTLLRLSYLFMMGGISVKAALFPVFTWLPRAHGVAQSAISALLSGLIVKGGLYLFFRLNFLYEGAGFAYSDFFFYVGALTAIVGVMFALSQKDMKQILAYHTVSQVGIIMMGLSSVDEEVFFGGVMHTFNHAFFKSLLFLGAGMIIKVYRTRKVGDIRGVARTMPLVSIFMIVGMLSITGAPLFNGFISKSIIMYGFAETSVRYWILFAVNIGTATSFVKMAQIFFGPKTVSYPMRHLAQNTAMMMLALGCIILGNFYIPFTTGFFGIPFDTVGEFHIGHFFDYAVTVGIAYMIFRFIVAKDYRPIRLIREYQVSFETANYVFIVYLVALTTYFILI